MVRTTLAKIQAGSSPLSPGVKNATRRFGCSGNCALSLAAYPCGPTEPRGVEGVFARPAGELPLGRFARLTGSEECQVSVYRRCDLCIPKGADSEALRSPTMLDTISMAAFKALNKNKETVKKQSMAIKTPGRTLHLVQSWSLFRSDLTPAFCVAPLRQQCRPTAYRPLATRR